MATTNLRLNRQQLAQFLPSAEAIKAFEQLFTNAYDTIPSTLESVETSAQTAQLQAAEALAQLAYIANTLSLALYGVYQETIQQDVYLQQTDQQKLEEVYIPPTSLDKYSVGLGNVDNTSDINKPVSTAQQTALNSKENSIAAGTNLQYWRGDKTWQTLNSSSVGLGSVTNDAQLKIASNLADLNNVQTARNNLGLSTLQSTTGTATVPDSTPTTFATLSGATNGAYIVCCDFATGAPATYNAVALITSDNGVLRQTDLQTATRTIISISGLNLKVNQTSGGTQVVSYTVLKIS